MWKHEELSKYIMNNGDYLAHINDTKKETLKQHTDLVFSYFLKMVEKKHLNAVFSNFIKQLDFVNKNSELVFKELVANTIYFHDFGKVNTKFQSSKMQQEKFAVFANVSDDSSHSIYSSVFYFNAMLSKIETNEDSDKLYVLLVLNSYIISRHHGGLEDSCYLTLGSNQSEFATKMRSAAHIIKKHKLQFGNYIDELMGGKETKQNIDIILTAMQEKEVLADLGYFYIRFVFSLLVSADFYATTEFMLNQKTEDFGLIHDNKIYEDLFQKTAVYKTIEKQKNYLDGKIFQKVFEDNDINELRSNLFIETEEKLKKNINKNIFYLEAPTGSGKTNISINLALQFVENTDVNKIFYIFPYNALVEQTLESLKKIFGSFSDFENHFGVINSLTAFDENNILSERVLHEEEYAVLLQQRQFLHFPFVLTTHVNLFSYLFGTGREQHFPLWQLANSTIILDEIQSYRNDIWTEIIYFLDRYAELLNIKVLIMSATLPDLGKLIDKGDKYLCLNDNIEKYFLNPLFKERVSFNNDLLLTTKDNDADQVFNQIFKEINEVIKEGREKILVEFMYKKNALKFFRKVILDLGNEEFKIEVMTGDDNLIERKRIISETRKDQKIILIATQVVEAGVDIDMDVGFKQVSIFDSEEQFAGRINRSAKKENAVVYFFMMKEKSLYKNDIRAIDKFSINNIEIFNKLVAKDFDGYYNLILSEMKNNKMRMNDANFNLFRKNIISRLSFKEVKEKMELITAREEFTLVLAQNKNIDKVKFLWNEMRKINDNRRKKEISYAQWKVEITNVYVALSVYSYRVVKSFNKQLNLTSDDNYGDMYLILDGDKYFENGKFIMEYLNQEVKLTYEFI